MRSVVLVIAGMIAAPALAKTAQQELQIYLTKKVRASDVTP